MELHALSTSNSLSSETLSAALRFFYPKTNDVSPTLPVLHFQVRRRHPLRRAEGRGGERSAPGDVLREQPRRQHQPLQDHEGARLQEGTALLDRLVLPTREHWLHCHHHATRWLPPRSDWLTPRRVCCVQLVFSSSATVYGWPEVIPCVEDSKLQAANPYGRTKVKSP